VEHHQDETAALRTEIEELRRTLADVTSNKRHLRAVPDDNIYVFDDDDDEARAFDEFYRAYDELHAKKRRFLPGWLRR
jgi:hypothetical protein